MLLFTQDGKETSSIKRLFLIDGRKLHIYGGISFVLRRYLQIDYFGAKLNGEQRAFK